MLAARRPYWSLPGSSQASPSPTSRFRAARNVAALAGRQQRRAGPQSAPRANRGGAHRRHRRGRGAGRQQPRRRGRAQGPRRWRRAAEHLPAVHISFNNTTGLAHLAIGRLERRRGDLRLRLCQPLGSEPQGERAGHPRRGAAADLRRRGAADLGGGKDQVGFIAQDVQASGPLGETRCKVKNLDGRELMALALDYQKLPASSSRSPGESSRIGGTSRPEHERAEQVRTGGHGRVDLGNEFRGAARQKDPRPERHGGGGPGHPDSQEGPHGQGGPARRRLGRPRGAVTVAPEDVETKPAASFCVYQDNAPPCSTTSS